MSEIKALDKLREWSRWLDCTYATDDGESYIVYSHQPYDGMKSCGEYMREQCDEIEQEIQERYLLLPVDADDVPIHVGDKLDWCGKKIIVRGVCKDSVWFEPDSNDQEWRCIWANTCRHVKPRTLESVLLDMLGSYYRKLTGSWATLTTDEELASGYADEIRELLGGDAE